MFTIPDGFCVGPKTVVDRTLNTLKRWLRYDLLLGWPSRLGRIRFPFTTIPCTTVVWTILCRVCWHLIHRIVFFASTSVFVWCSANMAWAAWLVNVGSGFHSIVNKFVLQVTLKFCRLARQVNFQIQVTIISIHDNLVQCSSSVIPWGFLLCLLCFSSVLIAI